MDQVQEKQLAQRQEDVNNFCEEIKGIVTKYEGRVPVEIGFTQFSFWATVMMTAMLQAAQTPPQSEMN